MGPHFAMIGSVAVAISAYRSDEAVVALLRSLFERSSPHVSAVIVVDSLGSGAIAEAVAEEGWPVIYDNSGVNLGSAGNLARRMQLSAESGAEWCYCLNHDASWNADTLAHQLRLALSHCRVGAVYPVLHHGSHAKPWEDGRRNFSPFVNERFAARPIGSRNNVVLWSSSNGALYALAPSKEGVHVRADLWMGYEDLAYGIALHQAGWVQLTCREATLGDIFDYKKAHILGLTVHSPDKPVWYPFYELRNLILVRKIYGARGVRLTSLLRKFVQSSVRIVLFDREKAKRLGLLFRGAYHGILGEGGKGPVP